MSRELSGRSDPASAPSRLQPRRCQGESFAPSHSPAAACATRPIETPPPQIFRRRRSRTRPPRRGRRERRRRRRRPTFSSMTWRASRTLARARWFRRRSAAASSPRLALDRTCFRFGVRAFAVELAAIRFDSIRRPAVASSNAQRVLRIEFTPRGARAT